MPRPRAVSPDVLLERAMERFWWHGYAATSVDDLIRATGSSRHTLYERFGGKAELFGAALRRYRDDVVTPAFARVEADGSGLDDIAAYFEVQITRAERSGLPGPGCLMANTMTELAPHDERVRRQVQAHDTRLRHGFRHALAGCAAPGARSDERLDALARVLTVFTHGLWSRSRVTADSRELRRSVAACLELVGSALRR